MSAEIIYLSDVREFTSKGVRPNTQARNHHNQRYILRFDPNASPSDRWHWTVKFTRVFEYHGSAADIEKADKAARRRIEECETRADRTG